ncbi:MAG: ABC transporter permease, partial [Gemmatimonadaceae bacterium]
ELKNSELVTGDYFRAAGITPALGRPLTPDDDRPGAPPVALVSYSLWETQYARSPSVLGTVVWLNSVPFTVIGVMPQGYQGMLLDWYPDPNFWVPMAQFTRLFPATTAAAADYQNRRDVQMLMMMARLRPGVSVQQLQAALDVLATRVAAKPDYRFLALPSTTARFFPAYRADTLRYLWMLIAVSIAAVGIACFNLANLLLARAASRQPEIKLRLSLGAGRFRILRQFIVENAVLAACACGLSVPVAMAVTPWLRSAPITHGLVLGLNLTTDCRALGIGMLAGLVTAILAGVVPAWKASRGGLASGLKSGPSRRSALRDFFVIAQVAAAMTILVPAALMVQNLLDLGHTRLGYDTHGVLLGSL